MDSEKKICDAASFHTCHRKAKNNKVLGLKGLTMTSGDQLTLLESLGARDTHDTSRVKRSVFYLSLRQLGEVGLCADVEVYAVSGALLDRPGDDQDHQHHIGENGCEVHHLQGETGKCTWVSFIKAQGLIS